MAEGKVSVRIGVEGTEQVRAALVKLGADGQAALKRLNFDTEAGSEARLFTSAINQASFAARNYAVQLGPLGGVLSSMSGGWLAAGAAAGAFVGLLEQGIEHADAYSNAVLGVNAVLRATQDASGLTADDIEGMAERISATTLQTRESVLGAAQALLAFGIAGPDAFEKTLDAAADLSASPMFKGDIAQAVKAISQAVEGQYMALQRAGILLSEAQKVQIKNFDDAGDHAGALKIVLDQLANTIGGSGASQDQGVTGATHQLSQSWDKLLIDLGSSSSVIDPLEAGLKGIDGILVQIDKDAKQNGLVGLLELLGTGAKGLEVLLGNPGAAVAFGIDAMSSKFSGIGATPRDAGEVAFDQQSEAALKSVSQQAALAAAHQRAVNDQIAALNNFGTALDAKAAELRKPKLQQAIDQAITEAAANAKVSVAQLRTDPQYAGQLSSITSGAAAKYNAENADKTSAQAAKLAAALAGWLEKEKELQTAAGAAQAQALDASVTKLQQANAQKIAAADAYHVDALKGQSGYFSALRAQAQDAAADQAKIVSAEADKAIADAQAKLKAQLKSFADAAAAAQKENAGLGGNAGTAAEHATQSKLNADAAAAVKSEATVETNIKAAAAAQQTAIVADAARRQLDIIRQQQGALAPLIAAGTEDWNQGLKNVASEGLNDLQNGFIGVLDSTQKVGVAFDKLIVDMLNGLAKLVIEKEVLAPLAAFIDKGIDTGGSSIFSAIGSAASNIFSAKGNAFDAGHLVSRFADGGAFISQRTVVPMAEMGENGPEAVFPLTRGPGGKLGIAGGGGGAQHFHFSPQIVIGGTVSQNDLQAVRDELDQQKKNFAANVIKVHNQARSRGVIK